MTDPPEPRRPSEDDEGETPEERARRLIDNSSLGTEGAKSLRGRVSDEDVAEVLRRIREKDAAGEPADPDAAERRAEHMRWRDEDEEDYDDVWDNADADEVLDGIEDDALMDSIAEGVHGDLGPDELTQLLSGLRNVPDKLDIPMKNTARVERGEDVLPPRQPEGTTPNMAISEDAARLRLIAGQQGEAGALSQAKQDLDNAMRALQSVVEELVSDTNTAAAAAGEGDDAATIRSAGEHAGSAIEDAIAAVQSATTALDQAGDHCGAFRSTVGDIASKHGA